MKLRRRRLTCRDVNRQSPRLCEPLCNSGPVSGSAGNKERLLLRTAPKGNPRSTLFALPQPESRRGAQLRQVSAVIPPPGGPGVRIPYPPAESPSLSWSCCRRSRTPAFRAAVRGWRVRGITRRSSKRTVFSSSPTFPTSYLIAGTGLPAHASGRHLAGRRSRRPRRCCPPPLRCRLRPGYARKSRASQRRPSGWSGCHK
jgi:hypothetical protein